MDDQNTPTAADIERLTAEAAAARKVADEARSACDAKAGELTRALVAYAEANPHPWIGKKVKRQARHGYRGQTKVRRGVCAIYDPKLHRGMRELSYRTKPGETIVLIGAQTAVTLHQHRFANKLVGGETDWELDEGDEA